jgi:hypothetical protein
VRSARFDHHTAHPPAVGPAVGARGILYAASGANAFNTCLAEFFRVQIEPRSRRESDFW